MIRQLQLYTVCIVIIVIVLSQFTLLNESTTLLANNEQQQEQKEIHPEDGDNTSGLLGSIKNSKYAEPINEIKDIVGTAEKTIKDFEKNLKGLKDMLDIEKNINEIYNMLE